MNRKEHALRLPDVHKIAVLRANALGDFIFILPALEALDNAYPDAEIVLLAKAWHKEFLERRPSPVDRVVVIPPCEGVGEETSAHEDPDALEQFFGRMAREHFDLALQLHGGGRYSNPFTLRLGARTTIGLKTPDAAALDRWIPYVYFQPEIIRYLEVVALAGAGMTTVTPNIAITAQDLDEASRVVQEGKMPLVALHPGASDPRRRWPTGKFAAVGDALAAAGARVVVTGTRDEQELVTAVVDAMRADAQNLSGRLSLGGLAALFARCRVVVSNDSGPLHLAAAVGAPTVGIYWCFNMVNASELMRARHYPLISWQLICPICGSDYSHAHCPHAVSLVGEIPTTEVIDAALDLFERFA
jgi:ADP-heptose:LPS heptosyltransferase